MGTRVKHDDTFRKVNTYTKQMQIIIPVYLHRKMRKKGVKFALICGCTFDPLLKPFIIFASHARMDTGLVFTIMLGL